MICGWRTIQYLFRGSASIIPFYGLCKPRVQRVVLIVVVTVGFLFGKIEGTVVSPLWGDLQQFLFVLDNNGNIIRCKMSGVFRETL